MPVTDHASAFSVLPAQQQAILFILLVADSARSKAQLLANLHALGVRSSTAQPLDHASLAGLLDSLLEDDWLTVGNQHGYRLPVSHLLSDHEGRHSSQEDLTFRFSRCCR